MILMTFNTSLPHGVYQSPEKCLGQCLPLQLQHLEQLLSVPGSGVVFPQAPVQLVPNVFDRVQIWAASRPVHPVDSSLLQVSIHDPSPVRTRVVILKHCLGSHLA